MKITGSRRVFRTTGAASFCPSSTAAGAANQSTSRRSAPSTRRGAPPPSPLPPFPPARGGAAKKQTPLGVEQPWGKYHNREALTGSGERNARVVFGGGVPPAFLAGPLVNVRRGCSRAAPA